MYVHVIFDIIHICILSNTATSQVLMVGILPSDFPSRPEGMGQNCVFDPGIVFMC